MHKCIWSSGAISFAGTFDELRVFKSLKWSSKLTRVYDYDTLVQAKSIGEETTNCVGALNARIPV